MDVWLKSQTMIYKNLDRNNSLEWHEKMGK